MMERVTHRDGRGVPRACPRAAPSRAARVPRPTDNLWLLSRPGWAVKDLVQKIAIAIPHSHRKTRWLANSMATGSSAYRDPKYAKTPNAIDIGSAGSARS